MKQKGFNLISTCIGVLAAIFSFVTLAFNWYTTAVGKSAASYSRADWAKILEDSTKIGDLNTWRASRVFMIITFVVVAIVAVLLVVNLFVENKILAQVTKWVSLALIILTVAYFIIYFVGCINYGNFISTKLAQITVMPGAGPILLAVCGVVTGIFGIFSVKKTK